MAVFDTSAEINKMTRDIIKDVGLVIKQKQKLELILHTRQSWFFLGLYKDIKIVIDSLNSKYSIFVVKVKDHSFVLE